MIFSPVYRRVERRGCSVCVRVAWKKIYRIVLNAFAKGSRATTSFLAITSTDITPPPPPTTTDITTDHYHRSGYRHCHRYAATIIGGSNCAACSLARMYLYLENTFARFSHAATRAVSSELGNTCSTAIPRGWKVLEGRSMVLESVKHRSKTRAQKTTGGGRHSHSTEESPALRRARCRTVGRARSTPTVTGVRLKREPNLVHLR